VVGEDQSRAVANFLIGNDPTRWRRGVSSYHRVVYPGLYPGVNVRVRDDSGRLKHDVLVSPGADLAPVVIRCEGVAVLGLTSDGSLEMETAAGTLRQAPPVTWQELPSGGRMTVECSYRPLGGSRYGFAVPGRDPELPLVIDPEIEVPDLVWSTFLGTTGVDAAWAVAFGTGGEVIAAGFTDSPAFPTTSEAYDTTFNGGAWDAWVACFNPGQSGDDQLVWCTYLGGAGNDFAMDVAPDANDGSILVVGLTSSNDLPTANGYDQSCNGSDDAFVARLSHDGRNLACATYLGGTGADWAVNVDLGGVSGVTVSGYTNSSCFPTTSEACDPIHNGGYDAFVTRFDPSLSTLVFSTFLGGSGNEVSATQWPTYPDRGIGGLAVSASGSTTVSGTTSSNDFPATPGAYQTQLRGSHDAFLARLFPEGSALQFATCFGGSGGDGGPDLAIRGSGEIAMAGYTTSEDLPTSPGAYDTTFNGAAGFIDGFIARFDSTGSALRYSTYLGGTEDDQLLGGVALDALGDVIVSGTCGAGFPFTPDAYDSTYDGSGGDAFLVWLRPLGNGGADLQYTPFLGGTLRDATWAMALPADGSILDPVVLAGSTRSSDFPTTAGAFNTGLNAVLDAWIALLVSVGAADVEEPPMAGITPASLRLGAPHPNPSSGAIEFAIDLPERARVSVSVHDLNGRRVEVLLDREVASGRHQLSWDPEALRAGVMPGIYFVRLDANGKQESQKVVISP